MVRKSRKSRTNYRKGTRGRKLNNRKGTRGRKSSNSKSFRRNTRKSSRRRSKRRFKVGGAYRRSVNAIERERKACTGYTLHRTRPFKRWRHNSDDCEEARDTKRKWPTSWEEPSPSLERADGESIN
jgi:hypothetical protein